MAEKMTCGVAVVGCGTVGGATATLLTRDAEILRARTGLDLELRHVVDVNFDNARRLGLDESLFRTDLQAALDDPGVGVVCELIGGTSIAKTVIERALAAGKNVVTANKALLARHGAELWAAARRAGRCIAFEASCAGGIPIIRALSDGLIANRIDALYGIVNGTCNYILTAMTRQGQSYGEALAQAQADGLAEADPTLDVGGHDSAHKLAILAALAFGRQIDLDAIPVQGVDKLQLCDIQYGNELGYTVKLLAIAQRRRTGLSLRVGPAFISKQHPLAWVSGPFNAVSVYGHATGHTMYYGRGAGAYPTASAVVADIASLASGTALRAFEQLGIWPDRCERADQLSVEEVSSRYYLRLQAEDRPGVFARVAAILGQHEISISSLLQHEPPEEACPQAGVPVVITTHRAREGDVRQALTHIDALDSVMGSSVCIGIVDEHPEQL
ncbi:MAG: Homoserine dehydrogenase [Planctomycetes bacterium ADurb.Bin126]|nr:MAG: Homoserine dehydrogenase [Planctomycetes bacterium ADurb.Bin126]HQL75313.1 homoserine dehydrogenase [Phycisphaerae bacterium]